MSVIQIESNDHFKKEILEHKGLAIVDFRASRCGPCRMLAPIIDEIAEKHPKVKVAKVSVEEHQELASTFEVSSIPIVYFIKNGEVIDKVIGVNPPTVYEEKITEHSISEKEMTT